MTYPETPRKKWKTFGRVDKRLEGSYADLSRSGRWTPTMLLLALAMAVSPRVGSGAEQTVSGALQRGRSYLDTWSGAKSSSTSLVPTREGVWSVGGSAGEAYATALMAAGMIDPQRLGGLLLETLRDELTLTSRLLSLPDDYDVAARRFVNRQTDPHRIARNSLHYAVGLLGVARITGPNAWSERAAGIVNDLYALASVDAPAGRGDSSPLPSDRLDVNGPLLYLLPQLHALTGDSTYLHRARRLADVYVTGILPSNGGVPPARWESESRRAKDPAFTMDESGALFLLGLTTLYGMESDEGEQVGNPSFTEMGQTVEGPGSRRREYGEALLRICDGVLSAVIRERTLPQAPAPNGGGQAEPRGPFSSTNSAEVLLAAARFGRASGNLDLQRRVRAIWEPLLREGADWPASVPGRSSLQAFLAPDSSLAPGGLPARPWAGGSSDLAVAASGARDDLSAAWHRSAGARLVPWHEAIDIRADVAGDTLRLEIASEANWSGRLQLDLQSPLDVIGLPARFALNPERSYTLQIAPGGTSTWPGRILADGIDVHVDSGTVNTFRVWPAAQPNRAGEADPPAPGTVPDTSPQP